MKMPERGIPYIGIPCSGRRSRTKFVLTQPQPQMMSLTNNCKNGVRIFIWLFIALSGTEK
jgi:hypothetical protein